MNGRLRGAGLGVLAALALALGPGPGRAQADGEARCLVLGPLAVSSYVAFLERVAKRERHAAGDQAESTAALVDLYERLACPMPALTGALECLSAAVADGEMTRPVAETAESCMEEAGMAVR